MFVRNWLFGSQLRKAPRRDRRRSGQSHRRTRGFETLEDRRMLSTIAWNRGTGPGAGDTDGLNAVFGANAELARQHIDRAVSDWQDVIFDFHYDNDNNHLTNNTYTLTFQTAAIDGAVADATITNVVNGKPTAATIRIDNTAATHFLDVTPNDDSEFGSLTNAYTGFIPGVMATDFYATILHEIGHAMGISMRRADLRIQNFLTDTAEPDPNDPSGVLVAFNVFGGPIEATFTRADPGHLWEGPGNSDTAALGLPAHSDLLMNPGRAINGNERNLISRFEATLLRDAYAYTISAPQDNMMIVRDDITGVVTVRPQPGVNADRLSVAASSVPGMIEFTINQLTELVPIAGTTRIVIDLGDDDDNIVLGPIPNAIPVIIDDAGGFNDNLEILGGAGYDNILLNGNKLTSTNLDVTLSGVDSMVLRVGDGDADISLYSTLNIRGVNIYEGAGAQAINLHALDGLTPVNMYLNGSGVATINVAPGGSTRAIRSPMTIHGGSAKDIVNLAPSTPFGVSVIDQPVTFFGGGGADELNVGSGGLHAVSGLVTYHGGGQGDVLNLFDGANPYFVDYTISDTSVTRDPSFYFGGVNYSGVSAITLDASQGPNNVTISSTTIGSATVNGNGGDDNFIIGNGNNLAAGLGLFAGNGGEGHDTLTLNDSLSTHNGNWAILGAYTADPETVYLGLHAYDTEGFERVSILAGNGKNPIQFLGTMTQDVSVNAGGGDDNVTLPDVSNYQDFDAQDGPPAFHYALDIDGGGGFNTLTVDDSAAYARSYAIWPERMLIDEGAPLGLDFDYDSFQSVTVQASLNQEQQFTPEFHVFGTSSDIPSNRQMTILGSALADQFVIHPHDAAGNRTLNGNLGIMGGGGVDALVVDDAGSSLPINYRFHNPFGPGTTNIGGLGSANFGAGSDVERIEVHAGSGDDAFKIDSVLGSSRLSLLGGGGADVLDYSSWTTGVAVNLATGVARGLHAVSGVENAIGGSGNDLLTGDAAANRLEGRGGRDLVSGGAGADNLIGGDGEDIVLAGGTTYSATENSNNFIMAEWMRTDLPFAERVNHLLSGGGLNGATLLNRQTYATDAGGNTLIGAGDLDLFFGSLARDVHDYQRSLGEVFIDVDGIEQGHVTVDATALSAAYFYLDGASIDAAQPYSVQLQPGGHYVKAISGDVAYFTVTEDGLIDYDPSMDGIFSGRGTTALVINGVPIQVDATVLGTSLVILDYAYEDPSAPINGRMMPGVHHLQILGGTIAYFTVTNEGTVDYDSALDGVLSGRGNNSLKVNGAPIQVDATALGTSFAVLDYESVDPTAPIDRRMMPGVHHLQIFGGTIAYFTVTSEGTVDYDPALEGALTGRGTDTLHVIGRSVTVDATMSGGSWVNLDYTTEGTADTFARAMMPGKHFIYGSTGVVYYFTMNNAGMLDYDPNLEGIFTGWGTNVLRFNPQATPHPRPADVNHDGSVNGDDLVVWSSGFGATAAGDADGDNDTDGDDFLLWQRSLGSSSASSGSEAGRRGARR